MPDFDHIIVGFGLAGATLEYALTSLGQSVLVIDRNELVTSSKIAAGLLTPITGKRFATTPDWRELRPAAEAFYRAVEAECGRSFFHTAGAIRLFANVDERERFNARRHTISDLIAEVDAISPQFDAEFGGYRMPGSARLDVASFLSARRSMLGDRFQIQDINPNETVVEGEVVRMLDGLTASALTFCCGFYPEPNPWFPNVEFEAAKGEMLLLKIPELTTRETIHAAGIWLAPGPNETYRAGATYDWDDLSPTPTPAGRAWLEQRLHRFLATDFEIVDHLAAVRPIVMGRQPVVQAHPKHPHIRMINGLGSKGSLHAPVLACELAAPV